MTADNRKQPDSTSGPPAHKHEGIRETLESIVVAFILAFVFRAFVVEAFVIPTGSMAAGLNGEHGTHTCTDCGWEYAYGLSSDRRRPSPTFAGTTCPNCGFKDDVLPRESEPPDNGDRILVLKWPFDVGGNWLGPKRWDPTVFKDPADGRTNFIKRLVGCPNEVLEIIDGDIYTVPVAELRDAQAKDKTGQLRVLDDLDMIRHLNYRRMEIQRQIDAGINDEASFLRERTEINRSLAELQRRVLPVLSRHLRIQRKAIEAPRAQQSLWFVVFDQDYLPTQRAETVGWKPYPIGVPSGWDASRRVVEFRGVDRPLEHLRLVGRYSTNTYAYNMGPDGDGELVTDRRIRCLMTPLAGEGRFLLRLTKYGDEFVAELSPAQGKVSLTMTSRRGVADARTVTLGTRSIEMPPGKPVEVCLTNVDYRVSLAINGREELATNDDTYRPDVARLRHRPQRPPEAGAMDEPVAELAAEHLDLDLRHLVVERDVYYTNAGFLGSEPANPSSVVRTNPFRPPSGAWGRPISRRNDGDRECPGWGTEGNPVLLRDKEYFMLGDNSPASKDSRLWWEVGPHLACRGEAYQVGTVPEDQLIGRAFFVYWPSGFRAPWAGRIALIPNVGEMRWIR